MLYLAVQMEKAASPPICAACGPYCWQLISAFLFVTLSRVAEVILSLWENSLKRHPYMFYMGTDFRKLKAPALWYDLVSVTDFLSKYDFVRSDSRFCEMIDVIKGKQDADGMFIPESVYQKFKGWDFGQKKTVSPYLTYLCTRILKQVHG